MVRIHLSHEVNLEIIDLVLLNEDIMRDADAYLKTIDDPDCDELTVRRLKSLLGQLERRLNRNRDIIATAIQKRHPELDNISIEREGKHLFAIPFEITGVEKTC